MPAQRLEAEAEGDAIRAEISAAGSHDPASAPEAKRQRVEAAPAAPADGGPSLLLLTVVCREGEGLEAQEAQVEVDRSLTGAQLKQSLLDAGIGAEGLKARDLQLSTSVNGQPMLVRVKALPNSSRLPKRCIPDVAQALDGAELVTHILPACLCLNRTI